MEYTYIVIEEVIKWKEVIKNFFNYIRMIRIGRQINFYFYIHTPDNDYYYYYYCEGNNCNC